ncbi:glycosyltransferase [Geomonas azotofigens]|uniref:glycosyltransferase n=1 Tax=Geomonas azotofigens TaxID=2843196 RepID=UPI001C106D4E|nr:glycosyltransferase [Geomonas azotofigens]MBU5614582.1 glycosyltransferase [Geomonas azotofigens]
MPKLKILFISHSSYLFGAENCALALIEGLDKKRFDTAAVLPADGPFREKLSELGVKTHILPLEWWVKNEGRLLHAQHEIPLALDRLLRIIDEEKPDVIHSNTSVICWGAIAAALKGIPHVWHVHEILNGHPSLQSILPLPLLYESINFLTDRAVTVSQAVSDELAGFVDSAKVRLIYNGVPCHAPTAPGKLRNELGAGPQQRIAVCVTSLQKYKGLDNLVAAAAKACTRDEQLLFAIAGAGSPEAVAELRQQVKDLNLEDKVFHLGFRNDIADILAGSDLFVLPSNKEAFPLVVLEAMAHGKPVVATDCGGTREMVLEAETGFIVPVQDPEALAEKILELCSDPARGAAMGEAARRRYCANFTIERYVESFAGLYQELSETAKVPLNSRQASLLHCFVEAYREHLTTMRVIPNLEQELTLQKRQFAEVSLQLSRQQEALLACERQKAAMAQEHAEQLLSLATAVEDRHAHLETRLESKKIEKADLKERLNELADELALADELRAELEKYLDHRSTEIESREERIRQMEEELAGHSALQAELEAGLQQRVAEVAALSERICALEAALEAAEASRTSAAAALEEATAELAARDDHIRQIEEHLAEESRLAAEELARKEEEAQQARMDLQSKTLEIAALSQNLNHVEEEARRNRIGLEGELRSKSVEIAALCQRLRQVEEEMLQEQERVAQFVAQHEEGMKAAEGLRTGLEERLQQQAVLLQGQEQMNRQALEELARQSALAEADLAAKEETIRSLGELLENAAHRYKAAEQELTLARAAQEEERNACQSQLREREQRIDDLLNSLSWRVTGPLRKAYDLVRGR